MTSRGATKATLAATADTVCARLGHMSQRASQHTSGSRHPEIVTAADGISQIDTVMGGDKQFNSVYLIAAREPALIEAGPGADVPVVMEALKQLGVGRGDLAHIVVTHIHLDHAGGAGALVTSFPRATVWAHERGVAHLADPSRLLASTARTYGDSRMHELYGTTEPVPRGRLRSMNDGDRIDLGDRFLDVIHTPGHASHHVALHEGSTGVVFTGEAVGSHLPWADCYRPALPPPEVDVATALASVQRIRDRDATALLTSHFGVIDDPLEGCDRAAERIREWSEAARTVLESVSEAGVGEVTERLRRLAAEDFLADSGREIDMRRYNLIGSIEMNAMGLTRYWRKRWEAEAAS